MRRLIRWRVALVVGGSVAVVACSRKEEASSASAPAASSTTAVQVASHASTASAWTADHDHKAPHGGRVHTAGDGHVEVKIVAGTARVWLLDHELHSVSAKGITATIRVRDEDPVAMTYDPSGEAFTAKVEGTSPGLQVETSVELTDASGKKSSARFFLTAE